MNKSVIFLIGIFLLVGTSFVSAGCSGTYTESVVSAGCSGGAYGPDGRLCSDITSESTCNSYSVCNWRTTVKYEEASCSSLPQSSCDSTSGCSWTGCPAGEKEVYDYCSGTYLREVSGPHGTTEVSTQCPSYWSESYCKAESGCTVNTKCEKIGCPAGEELIFDTCSGTYTESVSTQTCTGRYKKCQVDGAGEYSKIYSFFALVTGNALVDSHSCTAEELESQDWIYCYNDECDSNYLGICSWKETTQSVTKQCSSLTESQCGTKSTCSADYKCVKKVPTCTSEEVLSCEGDYSVANPVPGVSYPPAIPNSCREYTAAECEDYAANGCSLECIKLIPVLKWMDTTEAELYDSTSLSSPLSKSVGVALKLIAENSGLSNSFTLVGKEAGSTFSKIITGVKYSGILKANWKINIDDLNAIGDTNNDGIYEIAFKYDGKESQTLYYEKKITHCENKIKDADEVDTDCGGADCQVCPPKDSVLKWTDSTGAQILSQIIWGDRTQAINVKMVVENPATELKTFEIKEDSGVTVRSNIPAEISENKWTYLWTITANDLKAANEADGDNDYTFTFEADSKVSPELSLTVNFDVFSCGNGHCDAGEDASTCSSDCFIAGDGKCENGENGQADKGETCENSISDCVCTGPTAFWAVSTATPYQLDANNLSGHEFRMVLANPSESPGKFVLKEADPVSDDRIREFTGEKDTERNTYGYNWSTSYSDFWNANKEVDNIYEFYFEVDGQKSKKLLIEIINGDIPTCSDGVLNGNEERVDCGGDCDKCAPLFCADTTVCRDYKDSASCEADATTCKVADISAGALSGDQKALCFWENNKCNVKKTTIGVGDCNYAENYGEDTCDEDGFLSYSYKAEFIWSPNNKYGVEVKDDPDYVYDAKASTEEGIPIYRYDQNRESLKCKDGTRTVQCPAQIQLSFFDWRNLVAVVILIIIIYFILESIRLKKIKKKTISSTIVKKKVKKKVISKKKSKSKKKK